MSILVTLADSVHIDLEPRDAQKTISLKVENASLADDLLDQKQFADEPIHAALLLSLPDSKTVWPGALLPERQSQAAGHERLHDCLLRHD